MSKADKLDGVIEKVVYYSLMLVVGVIVVLVAVVLGAFSAAKSHR